MGLKENKTYVRAVAVAAQKSTTAKKIRLRFITGVLRCMRQALGCDGFYIQKPKTESREFL